MALKDDLVARARDIAELAGREAHNTEANRKLDDEVVRACCDADLLQVMVPKELGGHELDYATMAAIVYEFGKQCPSTAWVISFYLGHNFIHSLFPQESQQEVFAEKPYVLMAGTVAPSFRLTPVEGGYIVSGTSQWNSGSAHANWFMGSGLVMVDGEVRGALAFLAPRKDVDVIDNWDVAGMRGTSSGDMGMEEVFVPAYHTVAVQDLLDGNAPGGKLHANPQYSLPLLPFVLGETVPVTVGAYRGAADAFMEHTTARYNARNPGGVPDKQLAQVRVGEGQAGAAIAETLMHDYAGFLSTARPDDLRPLARRAEIRARVAMITDYCHAGIQKFMLGGGGGAFRGTVPLQRFYRDISMLRVHGFLDLDTAAENHGRLIFGLEPTCPL